MFREVLKISPQVDNGDLNAMERKLSTRFGRVAKKFGKGLVGALAGGGLAGLAVGAIDKLLNPLKETQDAIERILKSGGDVVSNAEQFGTTPGKLLKLQKLAQAKGLDAEGLYTVLGKFQTALAEARLDPKKESAVRGFTPVEDTADAFFWFLQSLQKLTKDQQIAVQQEVFGEKQILKVAEFFNANIPELVAGLKAKPSEAYTADLRKLDDLGDLANLLEARRELEDIGTKARTITPGMITSRDQQLRLELARENQRIAAYKTLATISEISAKIMFLVEKGIYLLTDAVMKLGDINGVAKKLTTGRGWRGIFSGDKGGK